MSDFEISFENEVGRYEFEPATAAEIEEMRNNLEYLEKMSDAEAALHLGCLVRRGRFKKIPITSEMLEQSVRVLVECKSTPFEKVAATVASTIGFGPLDRGPIGDWRDIAHHLRLMFERKSFVHESGDWNKPMRAAYWPHPAAQHVGDLGIFLMPDKDGKPVLALSPHDIQDALILCAARMLATGTTFSKCLHCNTPFLRGGSGQGKRRGDARFCSDECKWSYHNEMRRKVKRKSKL